MEVLIMSSKIIKEKDKIKYEQGLQRINSNSYSGSNYRLNKLERDCATQESIMTIHGDSVTLSTNGFIISSLDNIEFSGYWSWDRADEWLPKDYESPIEEHEK